jgi:hypothetical protein
MSPPVEGSISGQASGGSVSRPSERICLAMSAPSLCPGVRLEGSVSRGLPGWACPGVCVSRGLARGDLRVRLGRSVLGDPSDSMSPPRRVPLERSSWMCVPERCVRGGRSGGFTSKGRSREVRLQGHVSWGWGARWDVARGSAPWGLSGGICLEGPSPGVCFGGSVSRASALVGRPSGCACLGGLHGRA